MPKSKRAKVVHTSKTQKKGKELSLRLYANIQECITQYPYLYVFSVDNMRNNHLKDVRSHLTDSRYVLTISHIWSLRSPVSQVPSLFHTPTNLPPRLFFGKTKVMALALSHAAETNPSLGRLHTHLAGEIGLIFSPQAPSSLLPFLHSFHPASFARTGTAATRTFTVPAGTLYTRGGEIPIEDDVPVQHSMEPGLRKLGLPTRMNKGKVELENEFTICKMGEMLGSGQTTLLKGFGVAMAEFRVRPVAVWKREEGVVEELEGKEGGMDVDGGGVELEE